VDQEVEYGAHLPLIDLGAGRSLATLRAYARAAAGLGYRWLCANDHLLFGRPWLDGPTALAAVLEDSGDLRLATTASLPVLRGPVPLAKTLAALDLLSGGRLVAGVLGRRLRRRRHRLPGALAALRGGRAGAARPAPG
jgi:alkanesulfonate monooxygenase SsuD/methylene tetrahydromethanopterin reductase-like flavin-dependent oxidoreductase (luciferase family)